MLAKSKSPHSVFPGNFDFARAPRINYTLNDECFNFLTVPVCSNMKIVGSIRKSAPSTKKERENVFNSSLLYRRISASAIPKYTMFAITSIHIEEKKCRTFSNKKESCERNHGPQIPRQKLAS